MSNYFGNINGNVTGNVTGNVIGNVLSSNGNSTITGGLIIVGPQTLINGIVNVRNNLSLIGNNTNIPGSITTINNLIKGNLITKAVNGNLGGNINNNTLNIIGDIYSESNNDLAITGNLTLPSDKLIKCNKIITNSDNNTLTISNTSGNLHILGNTFAETLEFTKGMNTGNQQFTVNSTNGNTNIMGTLGIGNALSVNNNNFTVDTNGNINMIGSLEVNDNITVNSNKFNIIGATGNTTIAGTLDVMNDMNVNNDGQPQFTVNSATGNTNIKGTIEINDGLRVGTKFFITNNGNTTIMGSLGVDNNLQVNTNKFIIDTSGNTFIAGTLDVIKDTNVNTNKLNINAMTGNTSIAGTLDVKNIVVNTNKFIIDSTNNNTNIAGTLAVKGNMNVNNNIGQPKFTVADTGNTNISGSLDVANNITVNTNMFTVNSNGNTTIAGTLGVLDGIKVNVDKFTVASTGNTQIMGTLAVNGNMVTNGNFNASGVTTLNGSTINIGTNGSIVNIMGNTNMIQTTNLQINNKHITLNKGGSTSSASGAGIEFEENNNVTGYIKVANDRSSYNVMIPNNNNIYTMLVKDASGNMDISGNLTVNTNKFNVIGSTGNTTIAGTLGVTNGINVNTKFNVNSSGNTLIGGTLDVSGNTTMKSLVIANNMSVNTGNPKFTVASATGNTFIAGTLDVSGNTNITGTLNVANNISINTVQQFTVAAMSGNTSINGTLGVTGNTSINGTLTSNGTVNLTGSTILNTTTINGPLSINGITSNNTSPYIVYYNTSTGNLSYDILSGGGMTFTKSSTQPTSGTNGDEWYSTTNNIFYKYVDGIWNNVSIWNAPVFIAAWNSSLYSITPSISNTKYIGFIGNYASSTSEGSSFTINIPNNSNGMRLILQAAGGGSSNNDYDGDSSANSGATCVFDISSAFSGNIKVLIGSAGRTHDGNYYNCNPRSISLVSNPMGDSAVIAPQSGFAGNGAFNACVLRASDNALFAYAEGGGATLNYDSPNTTVSRAYVTSGISYITSLATYTGPISPGRGYAPTNDDYPSWNFNIYTDLATCYGLASSIASNRYGKGGKEAALNSPGSDGYPGFLWIYFK